MTESGGSIERKGYAPSPTQAFIERVSIDTPQFAPLSNGQIKSVMLKPMIRSSIVCLFFSCSPPTICFKIAKVVIDSIKRHSGCGNSHIGNETRKTIFPLITNTNPPRPVIFIESIILIIASVFYSLPNRIDSIFTKTMCRITGVKVSGASACPFFMKTSARKAHARFKMVASHLFLDPTIAYTRTMPSYRKHCPSFKSLSHNNRIDFTAWHKFLLCCVDNIHLKIRSVNHGV